MGVVSDDAFTLATVRRTAQVGQAKEARCKAVVVPADGGDALPLCLATANHPNPVIKDGGRWRPVHPHHERTNPPKAAAA
ncbi:hypothetical protein [Streptomyces tsukubensis]|uniref:hypothetical protein n=1 Tax=Streptomyces tsukubensis TaxID=83656 RepID=UPI0034506A64